MEGAGVDAHGGCGSQRLRIAGEEHASEQLSVAGPAGGRGAIYQRVESTATGVLHPEHLRKPTPCVFLRVQGNTPPPDVPASESGGFINATQAPLLRAGGQKG